MGQRYYLADGPDSRSNVYILAVADSGSGKDNPQKCIKEIAGRMRLSQYYGDEIRSDKGLHDTTWQHNCCVYVIDEIGKYIEAMLSPRSAGTYYSLIMTKFVKLWSSADGIVKEGEKGGTSDPDYVRKDIEQPCVSIFGSTVPGPLWSAIGKGSFSDGTLPRFLLFDQCGVIPNRNPRPKRRVEEIEEIIADGWAIMTHGKPSEVNNALATTLPTQRRVEDDLGGGFTYAPKDEPTPLPVHFEPDALERRDRIGFLQDELLRRNLGNGAASAVLARLAEHVNRIILIAAVADDPAQPVAKMQHVLWAERLVRWCVGNMLSAIEKHVADSEHEADAKRVLETVQRLGQGEPDGWVPMAKLTRSLQRLKKREREDIVADLLKAELLEHREHRAGQTGVATAFYRLRVRP
jgi:hypothetical protein